MANKISWDDISVEHYQSIYTFIKDDSLTDIEKDCKIIGLLFGYSESYIDNHLTFEQFKDLRNQIAFLHTTEVASKPVTVIETGNGRYYRVNYDVRKVPIARYAEVKHFGGDEKAIVRNLHLLVASMVTPVTKKKFLFFGERWVAAPYEADKHEDYANDILTAKFTDVWYAMVFFCNLYANWMKVFLDYSASMQTTNQTESQMIQSQTNHQLIQASSSDLDGFITSNRLPIITTSPSTKHG